MLDFHLILARVAELIVSVDRSTDTITFGRPKNGVRPEYLRGVPSMYETTVAAEVMSAWKSAYPDEFHGELGYVTEVPYPRVSNQSCDVVLTDANDRAAWGLEVKRLQFVGDNGKKNDHAVQKMLSPYLKDRS
ncbi:MAG: hypothetical protein ACKOYL_01685, partial [Actinomycetota bacterium]